MKTITISLYNRPNYTKILLDSLNQCFGIEDYKILITCEPGDRDVIELASSFRPEQTSLEVNKVRLGCNSNIFKSIARGFEFSDYNIHFEDDTIPGKDCLKYFEWANVKYKDDTGVFTVSGYVNSNNKTEHYREKSTDNSSVCRRQWFTPWGWATWRDRFREMVRVWDFSGRNGSWDCTVNNIVRKDRYEVFPAIPRTQNIGAENATHVPNAEWHRAHHLNEYWIETIKQYSDHFIEGEEF